MQNHQQTKGVFPAKAGNQEKDIQTPFSGFPIKLGMTLWEIFRVIRKIVSPKGKINSYFAFS